MKANHYYAIYSYMNPTLGLEEYKGVNQSNDYYILNVFCKRDTFDKDYLKNLYDELLFERAQIDYPHLIGPFQDKKELKRFCQELLLKNKGKNIHLISAKEFNSIIEKTDNIIECEDNFLSSEEVMENIHLKEKNSFLGRLFN